MYKDVLQVLHLLATAVLMALAGQPKDVCLQTLGGRVMFAMSETMDFLIGGTGVLLLLWWSSGSH